MNLLDFSNYFPNEESCIEHFKTQREKLGIVCNKCNNTTHFWKKDKTAFQCKKCGYRTALRSGIALEKSHLPYLYWYKAILMLSATRKTFSANEIQNQLRHEIYEPIWNMLHKIRIVMGKRDSRYKLTEFIEIDEGFFETINTDIHKDTKLKRGRGSQNQAKVLVLIESTPVIKKDKKDKHKPDRMPGHIKMIVMRDLKAISINEQVKAIVDPETTIISDGYNGTPEGFENICEDDENKTKPYVLHAEANAITKVAKSNNSSEGATLYVTTSPCMECSKLIIQSGIKRVVFSDLYNKEEGLRLLEKAKIEWTHLMID